MILILFTSSYPYDYAAEYTFIQPELNYLMQKFDKVVLVPRVCKGRILPFSRDVEVNEQYADFIRHGSSPGKMLRMVFSSQGFFQEIRKRPAILFSPSKLLKLFLFSGRAELVRRWVTDFIKTQYAEAESFTLYSYWFDHTATGLALAKQELPNIKLVSRAHGYDIYEEYYYPHYWPCRRETLDVLDVLFFASDAGRHYFHEHFPEYQSKFETAHLGIEDPAFINKPSSDGTFRIVSCAHIVPVKRLDLLLNGIATAARLRPQQKFEWTHFGDGGGRKSLNQGVARIFPSNAQAWFLGNVPNPDIMRYYRDRPVDVFVNVSRTEGGAPVSIQEAISCGIPAVATSVGGNLEIVSNKNGILLSPDPTPEEISKAFFAILDHPEVTAGMRKESHAVWAERYNAEVNFRAFAERLKSMGES